MDNSSCEWVRGRLPLAIGGDDGPDDPRDDEGDLDLADRRVIARHLSVCPGCRAHRAGLAAAAEAMAIAAASLPIATDAPSLWSSLERRIAGAAPGGARPAPDDDRPLRSAWRHDTFAELAEGAWPIRSSRVRTWRKAGRVAAAGLAASALVAMVIVPVAWRLRAGAEAMMIVNAAPVPPPVGPPAVLAGEAEAGVEILASAATGASRDADAQQLAQAEPIKAPTEPPPSARAEAAATRPAASPQYGYDLDHGIPMPPDGRDARPVY